MEQLKSKICLFILLFINFAFGVKYLSRITPHFLLVSILITVFYFMIWYYRFRIARISEKVGFINLAVVILFIAVSSYVFVKIPFQQLHVDRWSVIDSFWNNYFKGEYVYFAKSHLGFMPGPMPFYFILALPFYLIGELGYYSLLGIVIFYLLLKYNAKPASIQLPYLLFVMYSLSILWEIACRSNIFLNGIIILSAMTFFFRTIEREKNYILWNGLLIGLVLSTRNVFVIPYIITFLFALKYKMISFKNVIVIAVITVSAFACTFLPFVINHLEDFMIMNPFIIQSNVLMPLQYTIFSILLSFITYFAVNDRNDVFFYSGLILFFTIILHFIYHIIQHNFTDAYFNSAADVGYFILCIPFLLNYLIAVDTKRFGKLEGAI